MVGLLVVTHGRFSRELIKSIELIIGHQKTVEALTLEEGDDVNKLREEVEKKTEELDQGEGVLVLVDLLGGSPLECFFDLYEKGSCGMRSRIKYANAAGGY